MNKNKLDNISCDRRYSGYYIKDGKVVRIFREYYHRDLAIAKLFKTLSNDDLFSLAVELDKYPKAIKKISSLNVNEFIKKLKKIAVSQTLTKFQHIIRESNPTSSGDIVRSSVARTMMIQMVLDEIQKRHLLSIYGNKARKLFNHIFYDEIIINK